MPTDKEIGVAAKAIRLRDSTDEFALARAALTAAEQVRASENKPNHGTDPTWPGPMAGED